ncbi:META domain-containing protein [Streptomyces sp. SP18CS02]|uniref:META domain-containing protein n=1 Tax=Streptomyces sp. SP18CS02 TaxID=3002531 RepID=UPI002E7714E4|nr:META domain-containing protein [Streptomyces sp. SP18CS02]MEE1754158.1 META domain-containing protein [Streptomyces sp. SP18CS02]
MQKQHLTTVAAVAALLALTACGTESGSGAGDGGSSVATDLPVTGVHWSVKSVTVDGKRTAAPAGAHVRIDDKGGAKGNYGCNQFTAKASVEGETVTVSGGAMTEMACPEPVQGFENVLRSAFQGELKGTLSDGTLTLTTAGGDKVTLTEQPPAPLAGTEWKVDSLTSGETATSLPSGTEGKAHFVFAKDGTVRGSLGCNSFTSTTTTDGSTITFGRVATTRRLCPGPEMDLERALLKAMAGKVRYTIEHRTLTLTAPNGSGFAAEAADVSAK